MEDSEVRIEKLELELWRVLRLWRLADDYIAHYMTTMKDEAWEKYTEAKRNYEAETE